MGSGLTYYFSSSGLASTAGAIQLYEKDALIDELCWGKDFCAQKYPKFSTSDTDNYSLRRCDGECESAFEQQKYYPEIDLAAIELAPIKENTVSSPCENLRITEVLSYYRQAVSEQFVELYNSGAESVDLSGCRIGYKNKQYPLDGVLLSGSYKAIRSADLTLVKNPSVYAELSILDASGEIVSSMKYLHGQRKLTSYALFDIGTEQEN